MESLWANLFTNFLNLFKASFFLPAKALFCCLVWNKTFFLPFQQKKTMHLHSIIRGVFFVHPHKKLALKRKNLFFLSKEQITKRYLKSIGCEEKTLFTWWTRSFPILLINFPEWFSGLVGTKKLRVKCFVHEIVLGWPPFYSYGKKKSRPFNI